MFRIGVCVASVFLAGSMALAQEAQYSTIETSGVAVVDTAPSYVEFWMHLHATGETLVAATEAAMAFDASLRKELQSRDLSPIDLIFSGVAIPDAEAKQAHVSVKLKFGITSFTVLEEGLRQYAGLCDKMAAIGAALNCKVEGPVLGVDTQDAIEETAIARATEKAYPGAKAAAQIMNGQIIAVQTVTIQDVVWNDAPDTHATQPDFKRLTCTARVTVSYAFSPSQP